MPVKKKTFLLIYLLGFLWSLSFALPLYVQSSFIESIVGINNVGLVVFISNTISFLTLVGYGYLIRRFSNLKVAISIVVLNLLAVSFLIWSSGLWSLVYYVGIFITMNLFSINLDVFLESISNDKVTGKIRTTMLTIMNIAILMSPLLMGYIVGENNYIKLYVVAGIIFLPVLFLLFVEKKLVADSNTVYNERSWSILKVIFKKHPNLVRIFFTEFTLRFFYTAMVLYMPIYLHHFLGFDWSKIGIMFTIMLLPFVLVEIPAGQLADKILGEKELLVGGLLCMAVFTFVMIIFENDSWLLWAFVLFLSRVGAALVEAMNETYFFKQVNKKDMDLINIFRDMRPLGWLVGALVSFILLKFFGIQSIFVSVIVILVIALYPALRLVDTK
jgi:MFS family permease